MAAIPRAPEKTKNLERVDEQRRTLRVGPFEEGQRAEHIIDVVKQAATERNVDVQGIFAYGRNYATYAGIRFSSEKCIWDFLKQNKDNNFWMIEGEKVYSNTVHKYNSEDDEPKLLALRKFVRAVYQVHDLKGEADVAAKSIDANYKADIVEYCGVVIAKWLYKTDTLKIFDSQYTEDFEELMEQAHNKRKEMEL